MLAESAGFLTSSLLFDNPQSHVRRATHGLEMRLLFPEPDTRSAALHLACSGHGAARGRAKKLRKGRVKKKSEKSLDDDDDKRPAGFDLRFKRREPQLRHSRCSAPSPCSSTCKADRAGKVQPAGPVCVVGSLVYERPDRVWPPACCRPELPERDVMCPTLPPLPARCPACRVSQGSSRSGQFLP